VSTGLFPVIYTEIGRQPASCRDRLSGSISIALAATFQAELVPLGVLARLLREITIRLISGLALEPLVFLAR